MTMHLAHPSLTLGGKKKGKRKFRNADEARKARELEASWQELQKKWGVEQEAKKRKAALSAPTLSYKLSVPAERSTRHIRSLPDTHLGAVNVKPTQQYTGDKIIGIGTMHKSNAVPIFNDEAAKDISRMRRG